jgi:protein-S-isoprenylcysteine O-methyltransferase Ste14
MSGWPGVLLFLPILSIRYGIVWAVGREAAARTTYFPPLRGREAWALPLYQVTLLAMIGLLLFERIQGFHPLLPWGAGLYGLGLAVYALSTWSFARPKGGRLRTDGAYRFSRNPMTIGFFLSFLGIVLLVRSLLLLLILVAHQISVHVLIRSEERWCEETFGTDYRAYSDRVRRYL